MLESTRVSLKLLEMFKGIREIKKKFGDKQKFKPKFVFNCSIPKNLGFFVKKKLFFFSQANDHLYVYSADGHLAGKAT